MTKREPQEGEFQSGSEARYKGHRVSVYRVENERGPYPYEFELYIDGEYVTRATRLEHQGASGPEEGGDNWTKQLMDHGKRLIDRDDPGVRASSADPEFDISDW